MAPSPLSTERELTEPTDQCTPSGRLDPAARGWARRPVLRSNLRGPWGRVKRWEYWCVTAGDLAIALTYADVDYVGLATAWVCDTGTGFEVEKAIIVPFARGISLTERVDTGAYRLERSGLTLSILEDAGETHLQAAFVDKVHGQVRIDVRVARPAGHEHLNVLIPWSEKRFQLTSKQNTRPAAGLVSVGDRRWELGPEVEAFGTLDHGRGIWPYSTRWNWGSGSGTVDGRTVGLQLGGKWTVGTGFTENAVCIDGRLSKIGEELVWTYDWAHPLAPWRVRAPETEAVSLVLEPRFDRHSATKLGVLSTEVHQVFGRWSGTVRTDDGEVVEVRDVPGWAEESRSRW